MRLLFCCRFSSCPLLFLWGGFHRLHRHRYFGCYTYYSLRSEYHSSLSQRRVRCCKAGSRGPITRRIEIPTFCTLRAIPEAWWLCSRILSSYSHTYRYQCKARSGLWGTEFLPCWCCSWLLTSGVRKSNETLNTEGSSAKGNKIFNPTL